MYNAKNNKIHNPKNNKINNPKAAEQRMEASAEALAAFQDEHPGTGGSTTGPQLQAKIEDVMNKLHKWDRAPFGQPSDLEEMTIADAFKSQRYAFYFGTTKEWLVDMDKFNKLSNKKLFTEWVQCVYIGVIIWQHYSNS
jgi:hypothetical protein